MTSPFNPSSNTGSANSATTAGPDGSIAGGVVEATDAGAVQRATAIDPSKGWAFRLSRAGLIGVGVSLILHSILLTVFAIVTIAGGGEGGRTLLAAPVEVALVDSSEAVSLNEGPLTSEAPGVEERKNSIDLPSMPVVTTAGGSGLTDAGDIGGNMGNGLGGAGAGKGIGVGDGSGGAGAGGTSFFGVEARGLRFAFVVDISGSMDGEKLDCLKRELTKAIDRLTENSSFVVLCFSSDVQPLNNNLKLIPANGKNKKSAYEAIASLRASGGTEPMSAFSAALRNRPRPDAIYFMTDGLFDVSVVGGVQTELRAGKNVPIHCISFLDRSSEGMMRRIAQMSDGSYNHIDGINALPSPGVTAPPSNPPSPPAPPPGATPPAPGRGP